MDQDILKKLRAIGKLMREQDNRGSDAPMFAVQESVRRYGFDSGYAHKYVWMSHANDYHIARGKLRKRLENGDTSGACSTYEKVYYKSKWRTVQWFFTEEAANDHVMANKHNLGKCRIYAVSLHNNAELRTVYQFLKSLED